MAETCYHHGKKIILVPGQKDNGKWVCQLTIPECKAAEIIKYQGYPPGESETEQEAKMAAFKYAKKILDSPCKTLPAGQCTSDLVRKHSLLGLNTN